MFKLSASQSNSKACYELSKIYGSGLHGITQGNTWNKEKRKKKERLYIVSRKRFIRYLIIILLLDRFWVIQILLWRIAEVWYIYLYEPTKLSK